MGNLVKQSYNAETPNRKISDGKIAMKLKILLPALLVLFGTAAGFFLGCNRSNPNPLLPAPPPPPIQTIWSNGSAGAWFNNTLMSGTVPGCTTTGSVTAVTDPISGDSNTLFLTTTKTCGTYSFSSGSAENPDAYYPSGHLVFDIELDQPSGAVTSMNVQYFNSTLPYTPEYIFPASLINSLSPSSFTHVSIAFTSFTGGYTLASVNTPFQISWTATVTGTAITVDNIQWTPN